MLAGSRPFSADLSTPSNLLGEYGSSSSSSGSGIKRSRMSSNGIVDDDITGGPVAGHSRADSQSDQEASPLGHHNHSSSLDVSSGSAGIASDAPKRIKTARACDSCRRKKIRCDVIDDGSPGPGDPNNGNGGLTCAHCRQYGFKCTFFLPITETRFKKKREREAEEAAAAARNAAVSRYIPGDMGGASHLGPMMSHSAVHSPYGGAPPVMPILPRMSSNPQDWVSREHQQRYQPQPRWDSQSLEPGALSPTSRRAAGPTPSSFAPSAKGERLDLLGPPTSTDKPPVGVHSGPPTDARVLGPTSLAYIVHSTAFVPGSAIEAHDLKHSQTFEVGTSGDGVIKLNRSRQRQVSSASVSSENEGDAQPRIPDAIRGRLAGDVAEKLINTYFAKMGHLWPVITKSEFLHVTQPPPLLFYAICGVAALDRNVPREVFSAVRIGLNAIFRESDILSNSSAKTVKALLILSLHGDLHGSINVLSATRMWNRLGTGLRMAQDLGLHREASGRDSMDEYGHFLEQKRRIWGACVTADRLVSISLGHPLAIDLTDCDVRLPSPHERLRFPTDLPSLPDVERPFGFNTEMLKLSILFGRVQKTIYSPTGLMKTTDPEIKGLLNDIDQWRDNLPEDLKYVGPQSPPAAGILHLCFACIQMLFFRVFMRISYSGPDHLKFALTIERMSLLIRWSRESVDWVDASGDFYVDTMQFVSYALVFCGVLQYHSWVRRKDQEGLRYLNKLRNVFERGKPAQALKEDLSLAAKTCEIIKLLCEAAQGQWSNAPSTGNLNPTAGVSNRRTTDSVSGIIWRNAPGQPGGGTYEAVDASVVMSDLPSGTIILGANRAPALVRTMDNGWQPVPGVLQEQSGGMSMGAMNNGEANLPDMSNFTYLGGSVWQDEVGRPVDRRGSNLMVVLPQDQQQFAAQQQQQQQQQQTSQNRQASSNANNSSRNNANQQQQQAPLQYQLQSHNQGSAGPNVNPLLNTSAFLPSTTLNGSSSSSGAATFNGLPSSNDSGVGSNVSLGHLSNPSASAQNAPQSLEGLFNISDPMMLNDPLIGMLDWQAWQNYLAPYASTSGATNTSGSGAGGNNAAGTANTSATLGVPSSNGNLADHQRGSMTPGSRNRNDASSGGKGATPLPPTGYA